MSYNEVWATLQICLVTHKTKIKIAGFAIEKIIKQTTQIWFAKFSTGFPNNVNFSKLCDYAMSLKNNLTYPV